MAPLLLNERLLYQYKSSNENFQQNQFLYKLGNKIVETTLGPFLWSVNCIDIIYFWKKVERASSHIPISKLFVLHFKFIYRMVILNFYDVYLFNFPLFNNVFYFYFASEIFSDIFWKYLNTSNISWWLRVNLNAFLSWFSKMFLLQKVNFYHKNSIPKDYAVFG